MPLIIGQKIRLVHEKGEGVITKIIDNQTVEVDMGDDFPVEFNVNEIVLVGSSENILLPKQPFEQKQKVDMPLPVKLGVQLYDVSLAITQEGEDYFELFIANPEKWEILFLCHHRIRNRFQYFSSGRVKTHGFVSLGRMSKDEMSFCKEFHFQLLCFVTSSGTPQQPFVSTLDWSLDFKEKKPVFMELLNKEGWLFNIRGEGEKSQPLKVEIETDSFFLPIQKEVVLKKGRKEVDIHIEKLRTDIRGLDNAALLFIQLDAAERAIESAIAENYTSLVLIHGIGEGKLKAKIHDKLRKHPSVADFKPGEDWKYHGGATEIFFKP